MLYIFRFLHQTTTVFVSNILNDRCISFVSYIKPQHLPERSFQFTVVYLSFPTSNHNAEGVYQNVSKLYIFRFLHQTTTGLTHFPTYCCCISFVSYIKPQLPTMPGLCIWVVYLSFPTSNHNWIRLKYLSRLLYIFRFLHQTTTGEGQRNSLSCCISFVSYIKPQPAIISSSLFFCCISFVSYIKPQP